MKPVFSLLTFALLISCQTKDKIVADPAQEQAAPPAGQTPAIDENPVTIDVSKPDSLIGLPVADVEAACKATGVRCRIVEIDGESLPVTMDFSPDRLNFKVNGGKITAVTKG